MALAAGAAVEVTGLASEGFAHTFLRATLVAPLGRRDATAEVRYTDFHDDDEEETVVERVPVARVRPPPPSSDAGSDDEVEEADESSDDDDFQKAPLAERFPVGTHVDVWYQEVWWEGTVGRHPRGEPGISVMHPGACAGNGAPGPLSESGAPRRSKGRPATRMPRRSSVGLPACWARRHARAGARSSGVAVAFALTLFARTCLPPRRQLAPTLLLKRMP
jgi:hypothetical protein